MEVKKLVGKTFSISSKHLFYKAENLKKYKIPKKFILKGLLYDPTLSSLVAKVVGSDPESPFLKGRTLFVTNKAAKKGRVKIL